MKNTILNNELQDPHGLPLLLLSLVSLPTTFPFAPCFAVITTCSVLGNHVLFHCRAFARALPYAENARHPLIPNLTFNLKKCLIILLWLALPFPETLSLGIASLFTLRASELPLTHLSNFISVGFD